MFQLALIHDVARVSPPHFALEPHKAIKIVLNTKFANKVLPEVGLCIAVFDLLDCEEGRTIGGDGALFYKGKCLPQHFWSCKHADVHMPPEEAIAQHDLLVLVKCHAWRCSRLDTDRGYHYELEQLLGSRADNRLAHCCLPVSSFIFSYFPSHVSASRLQTIRRRSVCRQDRQL